MAEAVEPEIVGLGTVQESALKQFDPLAAEGIEIGQAAKELKITNDDELRAANEIKKRANAYSKSIKDMRLVISRPIDRVKDALIGRERELLEPVESGKKILGDNILAYEEEQERRRQEEERRIDALVARVEALHKPGMTRNQVDAGKTSAKALITELGDDGNIPRVKLALVQLSNKFAERIRDIDIEENRAKSKKLEDDQRAIDEEKRQLAAKEATQAAEVAQIEADKAARRVEAARPKSNIVEAYEFEIIDPNGVARAYCSPDEKKIRAFISTYKKEIDNGAELAGIRIFKTKKVR